MKYLIQLSLAAFCLFIASPVSAQIERDQVIRAYVADYNAKSSTNSEATVLKRSVTIRKDEGQDLVAVLNGDYKNRLNLQRELPAQLDEMLPLTIEDATVIMTSKTSVIVDNDGEVHYAFSIEDRPELPRLNGEKTLVFYGVGVGYAFRNRLK